MSNAVVVYKDGKGKIKVTKVKGIYKGETELKYLYTTEYTSKYNFNKGVATCRLRNFGAISNHTIKINWSAYIDETISQLDVFEEDVYNTIFMMADRVKT